LIVRADRARTAIAVAFAWLAIGCAGQPDTVAAQPSTLELSGDLEAHDPSVIESSGVFYLFGTGTGLATKTSSDLHVWRAGPDVFSAPPSWIANLVPGVVNLWSPSVHFFGGLYHLYYAASTFGSGRSCIGHATRVSLSDDQTWIDQGPVVCSNTTTTVDAFNAIDPAILLTSDGIPWLVFGSFGSGIQLAQLTDDGTGVIGMLVPLAARPNDGGALQASVLIEHGGYDYLFTSFDLDISHRLMVGRAARPQGPYLDRSGTSLLSGGGTLVLAGDARFLGPGSNAVVSTDGRDFNVYHAYDTDNANFATLRIAELVWDAQGWPISGGP
jgi:arabinan endo-1,5-alpha-L-arabinosidase